jgi:phosphoglycolate phosphatase
MTSSTDCPFDTVVLDIDGTLIDSVYAHAWSWIEAFRQVGIDVPGWRIHRVIGMGGDRLVGAVTNGTVEEQVGDQVRARQSDLYADLSEHLTRTPGATELLQALKSRGLRVALASSGSRDDTEHAIDLLEARSVIDGAVSGDDAEETKPDTEPIRRAIDSVGGEDAVLVGDAVWDMEAAGRAGCPALGLRTGGIAADELLAAGAAHVYDDPAALTFLLDEALMIAAAAARDAKPLVRAD